MAWKPCSCPVCDKFTFQDADSGERCPVCGWTADVVQMKYPDTTGDNTITLIEARRRYAEKGTILNH